MPTRLAEPSRQELPILVCDLNEDKDDMPKKIVHEII